MKSAGLRGMEKVDQGFLMSVLAKLLNVWRIGLKTSL